MSVSNRKSWIARHYKALIFCAVLIALLELLSRRIDPYLSRERGMKNPFWQKHPTRGYSLKPGDYDSIWHVPFHINQLGFRGPEISKTKPAGTFRVVCLGDSITMGSALPEFALYPAVLQKMLSEKYPLKSFKVVNAGISGYMIKEEILQLKEDILPLSPDVVVLQYTLYDPPGTMFFNHVNPHRDLPIQGKQFLLRHVSLARLAQELYGHVGLTGNFFGLAHYFEMPTDSDAAKRIEAGWQEYFKDLGELAEVCKQNNIPLLVLIIPHRSQFEDRRHAFTPQKRLEAFSKEHGIVIIDPAPAFAAQKQMPYGLDAVHPSKEGHEIMAGLIRDWISENIFPGKPL